MPQLLYRCTLVLLTSQIASAVEAVLHSFKGIIPLHPAWGPRLFCDPGKNEELADEDYRPEGPTGPGIDER